MQVTTIGLDIAKNVFQVHGIDANEKVVVRKQLRRSQVIVQRLGHALPGLNPVRALLIRVPPSPCPGSTASAAGDPALFGDFAATTAEFDFSRSCIGDYGSSPSRRGPSAQQSLRPTRRPPGSRTWSMRACQVLRPRRVAQTLALALLTFAFPLHRQRRHPELVFYRGSMAGLHVPLPGVGGAHCGPDPFGWPPCAIR